MTGEEHAAAVDTLAAAAENTPNPTLADLYTAAARVLYREGPHTPFGPGTLLGTIHTLAQQETT